MPAESRFRFLIGELDEEDDDNLEVEYEDVEGIDEIETREVDGFALPVPLLLSRSERAIFSRAFACSIAAATASSSSAKAPLCEVTPPLLARGDTIVPGRTAEDIEEDSPSPRPSLPSKY